MKKKALWVLGVTLIGMTIFSACSKWEDQMGQDILPPSDRVLLQHDTIFTIPAHTVSGFHVRTSDHSFVLNQTPPNYFIGELRDTITGYTSASTFTQYNLTTSYILGGNPVIDSLLLYVYIPAYYGNGDEEITIRVYEAMERIYMDSSYYSDFDPTGLYKPQALAEYSYLPGKSDTLKIVLNDGPGSADYVQKWTEASEDTVHFENDSIFKDHFNGFYLTATSSSEEGCMAYMDLSSLQTNLLVRYSNDSTQVDTTVGPDFRWTAFSINEFTSQKINVFQHDYTGTRLGQVIDRDDLEEPACYVQGLGGVNTFLSFKNLEDWASEGRVSISSAKLIFDVLPEDLSGISVEDLPSKLMLVSELAEDTYQYTYDYIALEELGNSNAFGGYLEREATSMFSDTTYRYIFNMTLHFQSMVDDPTLITDFRLQVNNSKANPQFSKLWSNLVTNPRRIRCEVVYLNL